MLRCYTCQREMFTPASTLTPGEWQQRVGKYRWDGWQEIDIKVRMTDIHFLQLGSNFRGFACIRLRLGMMKTNGTSKWMGCQQGTNLSRYLP